VRGAREAIIEAFRGKDTEPRSWRHYDTAEQIIAEIDRLVAER
jgi:hypothetical protein